MAIGPWSVRLLECCRQSRGNPCREEMPPHLPPVAGTAGMAFKGPLSEGLHEFAKKYGLDVPDEKGLPKREWIPPLPRPGLNL
jgi:hypothetical protein